MNHATLCYLRNQGKTLLIHRTPGKQDIHNGFYVAPGGQHHLRDVGDLTSERGIDCVVREFGEETGLTILDPRLRMIATFDNGGRILGTKRDPEDWLVNIYEASKFFGVLKQEKPDARLVWAPDSEIITLPMHEGDREIWKLLQREGIFEVRTKYKGEKLVNFKYTPVG